MTWLILFLCCRAIVTDTINMLEPMYERLIKEVAREAAREAVASMNKQVNWSPL